MGYHLRARAAANDGGAPAHPRHERRLPADGEKDLRLPLGRTASSRRAMRLGGAEQIHAAE